MSEPTLEMKQRLAVLIAVPFFVLVGGGVWLYRMHAIPTWLALGGSGAVATALLTLYGARLSKKLTGKARLRPTKYETTTARSIRCCASH